MIKTIKVSSGKINIPVKIMKNFNIKDGTELVLIENNNSIILEKKDVFISKLNDSELDDIGWLNLAENSMKKLWDNKRDDKIWSKYL